VKKMQIEMVGDTDACQSYESYVAYILARPKLNTVTFASAYLTEDVAERLVALMVSRPIGTVPTIRFLIGDMNGFTRKAALKRLINATKQSNAKIEVLCPKSTHFHAKAVYAKAGSEQLAIVGSHNLTGDGLISRGELGVVISGIHASPIARALGYWTERSIPWTERILTYKEGRLPESDADCHKKGSDVHISSTGTTMDAATAGVSKSEIERAKAAWRKFKKISPAIAAMCCKNEAILEAGSLSDVSRLGYCAGACYDGSSLCDDANPTEEGPWREGRARAIRRIATVMRTAKLNEWAIISYKKAITSYKVTEAIRAAAKRLNVWGGNARPTPTEMSEYLSFIRAEKGNVQKKRK